MAEYNTNTDDGAVATAPSNTDTCDGTMPTSTTSGGRTIESILHMAHLSAPDESATHRDTEMDPQTFMVANVCLIERPIESTLMTSRATRNSEVAETRETNNEIPEPMGKARF